MVDIWSEATEKELSVPILACSRRLLSFLLLPNLVYSGLDVPDRRGQRGIGSDERTDGERPWMASGRMGKSTCRSERMV